MKVKAFVGKIYEVQEFETIKGHWRNLDVVLRIEDRVTRKDGSSGVVKEFLAIRVRGEQIDKFLAEVKEGSLIEAQVRFDCNERISTKGNVYLQNDMVFCCPEWTIENKGPLPAPPKGASPLPAPPRGSDRQA